MNQEAQAMHSENSDQNQSPQVKESDAQKEEVTIKDFQKLDIRIAVIREAMHHPNADKLLLLKVSIGDQDKQIVAGIRADYDPETLIGKQVVVINNLKSVKLRGEISEGMVLAAHGTDALAVLVPDKAVEAGSKVS